MARRIGAVLELPFDVKTKVEFLLGKPRFFVEFTRHKDIGLRGLAEWVQCPGGGYEGWAASAIADAQRITAPFRQHADEGVGGKLFIIPGRSGLAPLEGRTFWRYLRTNDESGGAAAESLLRRVEPREMLGRDLTADEEDAITSLLEDFTPHWVRHTHWTTIESRIGIPRVAARYAGHDVAVGLTFYLSGGHEMERARAAEAVEQGLGSGPTFDAIRYLYLLEHGFNPDETGLDLNPDAALRRIQTV